jgi:hypothetical protein
MWGEQDRSETGAEYVATVRALKVVSLEECVLSDDDDGQQNRYDDDGIRA